MDGMRGHRAGVVCVATSRIRHLRIHEVLCYTLCQIQVEVGHVTGISLVLFEQGLDLVLVHVEHLVLRDPVHPLVAVLRVQRPDAVDVENVPSDGRTQRHTDDEVLLPVLDLDDDVLGLALVSVREDGDRVLLP